MCRTDESICGVDEAGRGPIAGPVVAAAVILPCSFPVKKLRDSKELPEKIRRELGYVVRARALAFSVGWCWPGEIDRLNIHHATLLAMERAIGDLRIEPELVLVDGKFPPDVRWPVQPIIRGDKKVPQIQAASIVAKTSRDLWMERYGRIEPEYGFGRHKGYPTEEHRRIVGIIGRSPIHRKSFRISVP